MTNRITFLSHFIIVLACASLAFFAWQTGAVLMVWQSDASMMTSVIACLFVGTAVWLGWQAWLADGTKYMTIEEAGDFDYVTPAYRARSDFGHSAERWSVMLGLLGTTLGLSLQAKSLAGGSTSFGALATSLYTTGTGIVAALLIGVMVFSLDAGIRRARK